MILVLVSFYQPPIFIVNDPSLLDAAFYLRSGILNREIVLTKI